MTQAASCPTVNNTITQNSIYNNDRLGIDIAPLDVGNDASVNTSTNNKVHFPVLSAATSTSVTGHTCASCRVELFESDGTTTDPYSRVLLRRGQDIPRGRQGGRLRQLHVAAPRPQAEPARDVDRHGLGRQHLRVLPQHRRARQSTDLVNDSFSRTVERWLGHR